MSAWYHRVESRKGEEFDFGQETWKQWALGYDAMHLSAWGSLLSYKNAREHVRTQNFSLGVGGGWPRSYI
jgi:hypothetical protein